MWTLTGRPRFGLGCRRRTYVERRGEIELAGNMLRNNQHACTQQTWRRRKGARTQHSGMGDGAEGAIVSGRFGRRRMNVDGGSRSHRQYQQNAHDGSRATRPRLLPKIEDLVQRVTRLFLRCRMHAGLLLNLPKNDPQSERLFSIEPASARTTALQPGVNRSLPLMPVALRTRSVARLSPSRDAGYGQTPGHSLPYRPARG